MNIPNSETIESNEGPKIRLWASLSYWSLILVVIGYALHHKNRLVRYHVSQSLALTIFINITALFVVSIMGVISNTGTTRGMALTYVFVILLFRIDGTSNAWHGRLKPLPIFGNSLGGLVMGFIQWAEPAVTKAWKKMRAAADNIT